MSGQQRQIILRNSYLQKRNTVIKYITGSGLVIILLAYYTSTLKNVNEESEHSPIKESSVTDIKLPGVKRIYENSNTKIEENCTDEQPSDSRIFFRGAVVGNFDEGMDEDRQKYLEQRDKEFIAYTEKYEQNSSYSESSYRLPGLIGIGVEKCGTDALHCMLENHPMLKSFENAEAHYFDSKYSGGLEMYYRSLPRVLDHQIAIEKTPEYFYKEWKIPYLMKKDVPDSKLYVLLCDPVNRTFSDFVHEKRKPKLPENAVYDLLIPEIIQHIQNATKKVEIAGNDLAISHTIMALQKKQFSSHIVSEGLYYYHLLRWFGVYDQSEILILNGEDILTRPWIPIEQIQKQLKIPIFITKENFVLNPKTGFYAARPLMVKDTQEGKKVTYGQPRICYNPNRKGRTRNGHWDHTPKQEVVDLVRNFYHNSNEKLYKLIGRRFNWQ